MTVTSLIALGRLLHTLCRTWSQLPRRQHKHPAHEPSWHSRRRVAHLLRRKQQLEPSDSHQLVRSVKWGNPMLRLRSATDVTGEVKCFSAR
ncbi:hypothetical protein B0H11DRAFT_1976381 [Mycena galericulata]|nr:hypothetical protein B0H11DRAFT_1976381 [Mycena galericulata]